MRRKKSEGLITVEASRMVPRAQFDGIPLDWIKSRVAKDLATFLYNNNLIEFEERSFKNEDQEFVALHGRIKVKQFRLVGDK